MVICAIIRQHSCSFGVFLLGEGKSTSDAVNIVCSTVGSFNKDGIIICTVVQPYRWEYFCKGSGNETNKTRLLDGKDTNTAKGPLAWQLDQRATSRVWIARCVIWQPSCYKQGK